MTDGVLLLGLGAIGMGYDLNSPSDGRVATHARAFTLQDSFGRLSAVDPDAQRRRVFDKTYGARSYASLAEAISQHEPQIVVIATPTATHAAVLNEVLELITPAAVLCEKPLAGDPVEAESMVVLCSTKGVRLFVNYMRRGDPGVIAIREMIGSGKIRAPIKGVVWYSKGLMHNGSHFVDLMRFWFGSVRGSRVIRVGRRWEDRDPEPDFVLDFDSASIAFFAADEEQFSHYTVELLSLNGRLYYADGGTRITWQGVIDDPEWIGYRVLQQPESLPATDMARSQLNVVRQLALALADQPSTLCSGAEGLETIRDIYRVIAQL